MFIISDIINQISLIMIIAYFILNLIVFIQNKRDDKRIEELKKEEEEIEMANDAFLNLIPKVKLTIDKQSSDNPITEDFMIKFIEMSDKVILNTDEFSKFCDNVIKMHHIIYGKDKWENTADIFRVKNIINKVMNGKRCFIEQITPTMSYVVHLIPRHVRETFLSQMQIYESIYPYINSHNMWVIRDEFCHAFNTLVELVEFIRPENVDWMQINALLIVFSIPYQFESIGTETNEQYKIIRVGKKDE